MRQTDWTLRLAEGVTLRLPLAGPVARFLAWTLDALVLSLLVSLIGGVLSMLGLVAADLAQALSLLGFFLAQTGYGIAMEWFWRGQTIGKRVFGLRVIDAQGCRLRLGQVVLRNLLRVIDALPLLYLVGGVATLVTRYSQRLGDLAAHTLVVRVRRHALPPLEHALDNQAPSLRSPAHLAARLRQKTAPDEAAASSGPWPAATAWNPTPASPSTPKSPPPFASVSPTPPTSPMAGPTKPTSVPSPTSSSASPTKVESLTLQPPPPHPSRIPTRRQRPPHPVGRVPLRGATCHLPDPNRYRYRKSRPPNHNPSPRSAADRVP